MPSPEPRVPNPALALRFDVIDLSCPEALEKRARRLRVELRVGRLDGEEEPVLAGVLGERATLKTG